MTTPGSILKIADSPLNRGSNYWFTLSQRNQECTLVRIGADGLWDVAFVDSLGIPHEAEGLQPERFIVIQTAPRWLGLMRVLRRIRRALMFWRQP